LLGSSALSWISRWTCPSGVEVGLHLKMQSG
jgi:hypothetical protein